MSDFEKSSSMDKVDSEKQVHIGPVEENASLDGAEINASGHVCFVFLTSLSSRFWAVEANFCPGYLERPVGTTVRNAEYLRYCCDYR